MSDPLAVGEPLSVRMALSSAAASAAVVRAVLTGIADVAGFDPELDSDVKTAVSEACNNVSMHAYDGDQAGPMWVDVNLYPTVVQATVTDMGRGVTRVAMSEDRMGLGLAVINALADTSRLRRREGGGAQLSMWFPRDRDRVSPAPPDHPGAAAPVLAAESGSAVVLWCADADLSDAVLASTLPYLAAAAHFSIDGLSGVRRAVGRIRDDLVAASDPGVTARIDCLTRRLELTIGQRRLVITDSGGGHLRMV